PKASRGDADSIAHGSLEFRQAIVVEQVFAAVAAVLLHDLVEFELADLQIEAEGLERASAGFDAGPRRGREIPLAREGEVGGRARKQRRVAAMSGGRPARLLRGRWTIVLVV